MELIAPWNKESLFLTVTEYNDSDDPILASASVTKDQPFFNTAGGGVYIAAESFRLSAFAGDLGYIYQMLKPEWYIAGEQKGGDATESDTETTTNLVTNSVNVFTDGNVTETKMRIELQPSQYTQGESSLARLQNHMATYMNDFRMSQNSVIKVDAAGGTRLYKLLSDPAENVKAAGFGDRGLVDVPFRVERVVHLGGNEDTTIIHGDNGEVKCFCIEISVDYSDVPSDTLLSELKNYFSSGLHCFADTANNEEDWSYNGKYVMEILGPYKMLARNTTDVAPTVVSDPDLGGQPMIRCFIQNDAPFEENALFTFLYKDGNAPEKEYLANVDDDGFEEWAVWDGVSFIFKLSVSFNLDDANALQKAQAALFNYSIQNPNDDTEGLGALHGDYFFVAHSDQDVYTTLHAEVDVQLLQGDPLDNYSTETVIKILEKESVSFDGTIARSLTPGKEYPAISPNEMFQIYNGTDSTGEHMWLLNGHANGGFQIQIKKNMDVLRINKDFFDRLGLDPHVISYETIRDAPQRNKIGLICIPTLVPNEYGNAENRPQKDRNFSNWVTEIDVSQCTWWNGNMIDGSAAALEHILNTIIQKIGDPEATSYFRVLSYYFKKSSGGEQRQAFKKEGRIQEGPEGPEHIFTNLSAGDRIENLQYVSVESFSLFEGLQICVPSTPFQPMITSYSSGMRVLCELRLDFPVGPQAGPDGANQATNDFWVGDIQWSASNGHQYLQLSTAQQSIYNLEVRAQLVYRNANAIPPKPIWIAPKGGLFQCKIRLVSVK